MYLKIVTKRGNTYHTKAIEIIQSGKAIRILDVKNGYVTITISEIVSIEFYSVD